MATPRKKWQAETRRGTKSHTQLARSLFASNIAGISTLLRVKPRQYHKVTLKMAQGRPMAGRVERTIKRELDLWVGYGVGL